MGHNHSGHAHGDHQHATGNIKVAFFLNLTFTIVEIVGGFYTNGLAIKSDALHDLGDSFSLGLAWYFQRLSNKGPTPTYSYGYKRFSLLGAVVNSLVLVVGSVLILVHAIPELFNPSETDAKGMFVLSILGIVFNGLAVLKLRKGDSINERVVTLHLMEDILGWVAVLIGSVVMIFVDAPFIDPLLSVLITLYVLYNVYKNLRQALQVILQGIPPAIQVDHLRKHLLEFPAVVHVHDCHVWSMDGEYHVLTVHLQLDRNYTLSEQAVFKSELRSQLIDEDISHVTIEFDGPKEQCELSDS